ncbi:MAG: hypothetical protein LQ346_008987, partial [Caloplaca aetnensis]
MFAQLTHSQQATDLAYLYSSNHQPKLDILNSSSYKSPMAAKRLLEVESKFVFKPSSVAKFQANGGSPAFERLEALGTHKFTDTYFDHRDVLSNNGIWLRQRKNKQSTVLEAKVRISGNFARSTFDEITDRQAITNLIRPHFPHFNEGRENFGLQILAKFMTTRQDFRADGKFGIMLDYTDFGHSVGEVELMAEDEERAHREIDAFMAQYPWFFEKGKTEGKLAAYCRLREND